MVTFLPVLRAPRVVTGADSALARVARRVEEAAVVLDVRGLDVSFTSDFFAALDVLLFLGTIHQIHQKQQTQWQLVI